MIQAHLLNTLNMYVMSKFFHLDWLEVQRFLKKSHVYQKFLSRFLEKRVTFQGIFELQTNLEENFLTSHRCLRYSKGASGSHKSSTHQIMYIRCVEKNIFQFGACHPKKGPFFGGNGANGESGPETKKTVLRL